MKKLKGLLGLLKADPSEAFESIRNYVDTRNPFSACSKISNFDKNGVPERAFIRHIDRLPDDLHFYFVPYQWVAEQISNKNCLDAGCGMGSSTFYLAKHTKHMTGIDHSKIAINYAIRHYPLKNLVFQEMDVKNILYPDSFFDVVTSFEVLEHLDGQDQINYCREISRILKPGGIFFLSTPNRILTDGKNSHHLCELDHQELRALLSSFFSDTELLGVTPDSKLIQDLNSCPILVAKSKK